MKGSSTYHKPEMGTKIMAIFLMLTMVFALSIETFHYHQNTDQYQDGSTVTITKYSPQCVICKVVVNNINTSFLSQDISFEINTLQNFVDNPVDAYVLPFYRVSLQNSKNKGPPMTLLFS